MERLKALLHAVAIALTRVFQKLLPDKIPVTFVGSDAARELCEAIGQTGARKVLVVTDAMLTEIGLVARITDALREASVAFAVYDGVEPDPTFDQVNAGLKLLRREECDAVLALGGGSPMDAAKVIAASAVDARPVRKLEGMMKLRKPTLPLFAIPTTAGTGSEVTLAAVVSEDDTHQKRFFIDPRLLPAMTALDPSLMTGLPPQVTAATGMDALTHAVESYVAKTATPQSERYAVAAVRLIFAHLPTAYADGGNLEARKAMSLASYYAGLAFTRTGVGYVHAIAHTFGAYYRTPHGLANAIALPHVLEFSREAAEPRLAQLGALIEAGGSTRGERAQRFIDAVRDLMTKVEIPFTLDKLEQQHIPAIATQALDEAHLQYPVPRYMQQDECEALLAKIRA